MSGLVKPTHRWCQTLAKPVVIVLATLKGGSGKSTIAACLAAYWQQLGRGPALIDADPQRSLASSDDAGSRLGGLHIQAESSERIGSLIRSLKKSYSPVIVDTAGFRNRTTTEALAAAELALIPVKPSAMDVRVALETERLIAGINLTPERAGRPVAMQFVLSMTTPGSVIARHVRAQMHDAGLPLLQAEISNRVSFGEATLRGATPTLTEPSGVAAREILSLAKEIEAILTGDGSAGIVTE